jgi:RNA polymerase sigma-70 factor (ECF subfamily)
MHDPALVERALQGDRAAFEELVSAHQRAVFAYLRSRLIHADDAEDLTQEVFLRFYVARAKFDTTQLVRPWLLGIARNLLREHIREVRRRKEVGWTELCLELEGLVGDDDNPHEDVLRHLPACMEGLGPSAQEAIEMRYRKNLRMAAVAEKLRRSEGAVKILVHRARLALKHCLDMKLARPGKPANE